MNHTRVPLLLLLPLLAASGACARTADRTAGPAGPVSPVPASPAADAERPASPPAGVVVAPVSYRVTYGWGVPSTTVQVTHDTPVPTAPPASSLPYLVSITAGDHPEGNPAYARISFTFRGGFPSYRFGYVREVLSQGRGDRVPLTGNGFLEVVFVGAQTHDDAGRTTIRRAPAPRLDIGSLVSYGFGGDYEGYVSYGLGVLAAPNSDQVLRIRTGELVRGAGANGEYVVHVDVERA